VTSQHYEGWSRGTFAKGRLTGAPRGFGPACPSSYPVRACRDNLLLHPGAARSRRQRLQMRRIMSQTISVPEVITFFFSIGVLLHLWLQ
jgi:hypothetical protein